MFLWSLISIKLSEISVLRIGEILKIPEQEEYLDDNSIPKNSICIENGSFSYDQSKFEKLGKLFQAPGNNPAIVPPKKQDEQEEIVAPVENTPFLKNINVNFPPGTFTAIVGKVGTGKSSLLMAMMNELSQTSGICKKNGKIAYIPQ